MENENNNKNDQKPAEPSQFRGFLRGPNFWVLLIVLSVVLALFMISQDTARSRISNFSFLYDQANGLEQNGEPIVDQDQNPVGCNISTLEIDNETNMFYGTFKVQPYAPATLDKDGKPTDEVKKKLQLAFKVMGPAKESADRKTLVELLRSKNVDIRYREPSGYENLLLLMMVLLPLGLILLIWFSYRKSQNQMLGGGGFLSGFSKSPAKRFEASNKQITFKDVAGLEGVKADLAEIVEYLREPDKFRRLGGRVPRGVLLNGPPGTGKTLLAKAIAGEADVPFFSVNGSEFIQMFVGVGASRVRDLFRTAIEAGASIIFIDEIDAVGRQRGAGLGGGHDEREQTLNQILGEMDGFEGNETVIVIAATNRPDVLDPALLRPGRFDRHITVSRPTQKGRLAIFKVHVRDVPLAADVDLAVLAAGSIGMTGADIRNVVNEAALWAARMNKKKVEMEDFEHARDKVTMGAKREEVLSKEEKHKTAYHEAGHTIAGWLLKGAHPVHKVTIVPRGRSLGSTHTLPNEEKLNLSESEIRDHLIMLLAGRAAEKLIYDEFSVGAGNDLERATSLARRMVTHWGMSSKLGPVAFKLSDEDPFLGREMQQQRLFSEHTMEVIDSEVTSILNKAADDAYNLLVDKRKMLEDITQALMDHEELDRDHIERVIGPSVHPKPSVEAINKEDNKDSKEEESSESEEKKELGGAVDQERPSADSSVATSESVGDKRADNS